MTQHIPDSNELFNLGLSGEKPFLGSPGDVDAILRRALKQVTDLRGRQLEGDDHDIVASVDALARSLQDVFYGRSSDYEATTWNRPSGLGQALVTLGKMGGSRDDAAYRLMLRMFREYLKAYLAFEGDEMGDGDFQLEIQRIISFYTTVLIGAAR
jgi:hypothetical protein